MFSSDQLYSQPNIIYHSLPFFKLFNSIFASNDLKTNKYGRRGVINLKKALYAMLVILLILAILTTVRNSFFISMLIS